MSIILEFRPDAVRPARAAYSKRDFALEYAVEQGPAQPEDGIQAKLDSALRTRPVNWLVIADTLVMVFSPPDAALVALDAYTNIDLWLCAAELPLPEVIGGGLVCLANPPQDTDRIDLGIVPQFHYCESQARLRISFGRDAERYYRVSTCLVVGMSDEGIASLDISNLRTTPDESVE